MCEGEGKSKDCSLENNPINRYICVKEKEQVKIVVQKIILETAICEGEGNTNIQRGIVLTIDRMKRNKKWSRMKGEGNGTRM